MGCRGTGCGAWGAGCWGAGCRVRGVGCGAWGVRCGAQRAGCRGAGCRVQGYGLRGTGCGSQGVRYGVRGAGCGVRASHRNTVAALRCALEPELPRTRTPSPWLLCAAGCGSAQRRRALWTAPLQALGKDPAPWLLLWERHNYGQIGMVMRDKKGSGCGAGAKLLFSSKRVLADHLVTVGTAGGRWPPPCVAPGMTGPGLCGETRLLSGEKISHPLTFLVISQKHCNCAAQEGQRGAEVRWGPFTFVTKLTQARNM